MSFGNETSASPPPTYLETHSVCHLVITMMIPLIAAKGCSQLRKSVRFSYALALVHFKMRWIHCGKSLIGVNGVNHALWAGVFTWNSVEGRPKIGIFSGRLAGDSMSSTHSMSPSAAKADAAANVVTLCVAIGVRHVRADQWSKYYPEKANFRSEK